MSNTQQLAIQQGNHLTIISFIIDRSRRRARATTRITFHNNVQYSIT